MISSIFGKTKPINFIILLSFIFLFYWLVQFSRFDLPFDFDNFLIQMLALAALLFSFIVLDFIVKRNKLTGINSYSMLFYALFFVLFPETLVDPNGIGCSFFMLLALRRLISMRSIKSFKLKIFDATLWVMMASLCYDWAILYLILVFSAIYIYEPKNSKNWLVPFAGVFVFFIIIYSVSILAGNTSFLLQHYQFEINLEASKFLDLFNSAKILFYILLVLVMGLLSFLRIAKVGHSKIITLRLIALYFIIGIVLVILVSNAENHPIIVTFFPAAVFFTNYVETIKKPNIKEIVLIISILVPFLVLATDLLITK